SLFLGIRVPRWIPLERLLSSDGAFEIRVGDRVLFCEGVPEDRKIPSVKEVESYGSLGPLSPVARTRRLSGSRQAVFSVRAQARRAAGWRQRSAHMPAGQSEEAP